jgi:hypothetical protein
VGIAATLGPALTAWANRKHDRAQARSTRLYEQRRGTYLDVGRFLEGQRLILQHEAKLYDAGPAPEGPTDEEWAELHARVAISGSAEAQAKLTDYHTAREELASATFWAEKTRESRKALNDAWSTCWAAIGEAEQAMRDELEML